MANINTARAYIDYTMVSVHAIGSQIGYKIVIISASSVLIDYIMVSVYGLDQRGRAVQMQACTHHKTLLLTLRLTDYRFVSRAWLTSAYEFLVQPKLIVSHHYVFPQY